MHVGDEHQERRELLAALDDAEFRRLLDRIGGVAAGIGEADHLGLGGLGLQQERREVRGVQRVLDAAGDIAAIGRHGRGGVTLEGGAEGVVGGQEEPAIAAGLGQRRAGAVGEHEGVVGPVDRVRRALRVGQVGGAGARIEEDGVLFLDDVVDRQRHAGIRHIDDDIDLVDVEPLPRDVGADVRLVLVIAGDHVDLPALGEKAGIFHRHLRGQRRAGTADIRIQPGLVAERTDLDDLVLSEALGNRAQQQRAAEHQGRNGFLHLLFSLPSSFTIYECRAAAAQCCGHGYVRSSSAAGSCSFRAA